MPNNPGYTTIGTATDGHLSSNQDKDMPRPQAPAVGPNQQPSWHGMAELQKWAKSKFKGELSSDKIYQGLWDYADELNNKRRQVNMRMGREETMAGPYAQDLSNIANEIARDNHLRIRPPAAPVDQAAPGAGTLDRQEKTESKEGTMATKTKLENDMCPGCGQKTVDVGDAYKCPGCGQTYSYGADGDEPAPDASTDTYDEKLLHMYLPEGTTTCPHCESLLDETGGTETDTPTRPSAGSTGTDGSGGSEQDPQNDDDEGSTHTCPGCSTTYSYVAKDNPPSSSTDSEGPGKTYKGEGKGSKTEMTPRPAGAGNMAPDDDDDEYDDEDDDDDSGDYAKPDMYVDPDDDDEEPMDLSPDGGTEDDTEFQTLPGGDPTKPTPQPNPHSTEPPEDHGLRVKAHCPAPAMAQECMMCGGSNRMYLGEEASLEYLRCEGCGFQSDRYSMGEGLFDKVSAAVAENPPSKDEMTPITMGMPDPDDDDDDDGEVSDEPAGSPLEPKHASAVYGVDGAGTGATGEGDDEFAPDEPDAGSSGGGASALFVPSGDDEPEAPYGPPEGDGEPHDRENYDPEPDMHPDMDLEPDEPEETGAIVTPAIPDPKADPNPLEPGINDDDELAGLPADPVETHASEGAEVDTPMGRGTVLAVNPGSYTVQLDNGAQVEVPDSEVKVTNPAASPPSHEDKREARGKEQDSDDMPHPKGDGKEPAVSHTESAHMLMCGHCKFEMHYADYRGMGFTEGDCPQCGVVEMLGFKEASTTHDAHSNQDSDGGEQKPAGANADAGSEDPISDTNPSPRTDPNKGGVQGLREGNPQVVGTGGGTAPTDLASVNSQLRTMGHGPITPRQLQLLAQYGDQHQDPHQVKKLLDMTTSHMMAVLKILGKGPDLGPAQLNR